MAQLPSFAVSVGGAALVLALVYFVVSTLLRQSCPTGCPPCGPDNPCRPGEQCLDGKCTVVKEAPACVYNPDDYQACVAFTEKDFKSGRAKVGALDKHGQKITDWSECSKSCGGGVQFRYKGVAIKRDAIGTPCNAWCPEGSDRNDCLYERRACNVKACVTKKQVDEKKYLAVEGKVKKLEASLQTYQKRDSIQAKAIASTKSDMTDLRKQLQAQERLKKQLSDSTAKVTQLQTKLKSSQQAEKAATKQITSTKSDIQSLQQQLNTQKALKAK